MNSLDKSLHVLVVDDYQHMRMALKNILAELGFSNIHQASSGAEAKRILQEAPIAVVISDWNMPGMSGLQLLEWVRADERLRKLPFMLVTTEATREQIRAAIAAGVSEYLIKPFTLSAFTGKFQALFGSHPARPIPAQEAPSGPSPVVGLDAPLEERIRQSTVLVVDDVATNIRVIAGMLEADGYTIKVAISGKKALEIVAASPPSIILLDVMMPDIDGFEVCRRLKANPATAAIPIIFLSAKDQADDIAGGLELGAVDYVTKPVEPAILKARLRTHLGLASMVADLKRQNRVILDNVRLREDVERITRHDLKNPIGAILQTSQRLLADQPSAAQRESLQLLDAAARDALEMVNLSLDMYRMENGDYRPQLATVRLNDLLAKVVAEVGAQFADQAHQFVLPEIELNAHAEQLLCYSLFGNLITNAAEAAPAGSAITISGSVEADRCVVTVKNKGGVAPAIRDRFFEKYVTHGKDNGTGLGTYSARLMVEVQGGSIELSGGDANTCLTVRLQAA
jgi:two-component system, sensor histidine kinase and response regulator